MGEEVFENIKKYIGKDIICTYYHCGEQRIKKGKLNDISSYKNIVIDSVFIPFIGLYSGIYSIDTIDNINIYRNEWINIINTQKNMEQTENFKKFLYGNDYMEKYKKERAKRLIISPKKNVK